MAKYKSHKIVEAWKILSIDRYYDKPTIGEEQDYPWGYLLELEEYPLPFWVSSEYVAKHQPQVGGYYVQYADDYMSFSPAKAFEEGYTRIEDES